MSKEEYLVLAEITAYDPGRVNLLAQARAIDQSPWVGSQVTLSANATTAYDNQVLADRIRSSALNNNHQVSQPVTVVAANVAHIFSFYAKHDGTNTRLEIYGASSTNYVRGDFDLVNGVVISATNGGTGSGATAGMQKISGNGWYRCWVAGIPQSAVGTSITARIWSLDGTSDLFIGGTSYGTYVDRMLLQTGTTLNDPIDTTTASGATTRTLRFSSQRFDTTGTDVPSHIHYDHRIQGYPNFIRRAFGNARITNGGTASGGTLRLANRDQALSYLMDLGLDGRDIVIRLANSLTPAYPTDFITWATGTIEQPEVNVDSAVLNLRDRMSILDLPLSATKYAGTNTGTPLTGAEGVATDIKGQPKPKCWGRCYHVPAILVNTSKLTYQVHDGSVFAIDAVYDKGSAYAFIADFANLALLEAAVLTTGQYSTCKALGLFRIGGSSSGVITADVRGDNSGTGYVDKCGAIARRILESICGVPTAEINTTSFSNLDTAASYEVGLWVGAENTRRAAFELLQSSIGGWFLPYNTGIWNADRLVSPSGTAALVLTDKEIETIDRVATNDPGKGVPIGDAKLRYKKYWKAFTTSDLASGLTDAVKGELSQEWRTTDLATNAATKALHLLAGTMTRDTLINVAADAATERDRLLALHSARRDFVKITTDFNPTMAVLGLGSIVDVTTTRLGYGSTKKFVVLGVGLSGKTMELELWG